MAETKALAKLPNLEIEIRHRQAPDEGAEYLSISLRATPSFRAMADYLEACRGLWANPLLAWQAMWAPLLGPPRWLPARPGDDLGDDEDGGR